MSTFMLGFLSIKLISLLSFVGCYGLQPKEVFCLSPNLSYFLQYIIVGYGFRSSSIVGKFTDRPEGRECVKSKMYFLVSSKPKPQTIGFGLFCPVFSFCFSLKYVTDSRLSFCSCPFSSVGSKQFNSNIVLRPNPTGSTFSSHIHPQLVAGQIASIIMSALPIRKCSKQTLSCLCICF